MLRPDPVMIKLVQAASGGNFTLIAHPNRAPAAIKSALLSRRYGKPGQRSARVSIKHAALIGRRRLSSPCCGVATTVQRTDIVIIIGLKPVQGPAARMSILNASSSTSSSFRKSVAHPVLHSRLELNRPDGSLSEAPLAKVSITTLL
jgi:hypothetical protein